MPSNSCVQHDVDHLVVPSWQRRPSGLSKERSAGQAAAWAASPRPRVASTMGHPSSVGQGVQLASSAGLSQAAAVAVQPVGAAAATARGLKRMSTGDLRGRLTLGGTEYYLGRFPTTLAAAQAEDFVALWKLGPATAGELPVGSARPLVPPAAVVCLAGPPLRFVFVTSWLWHVPCLPSAPWLQPTIWPAPLPAESRNKLNLQLKQYGEFLRHA